MKVQPHRKILTPASAATGLYSGGADFIASHWADVCGQYGKL
jgi:hypothetical protein